MYLSFYGLKLKPFRDSTNPSFFWLGEMHKEVLTIFRYGILKMPGFLVLTGDIGTGKTALANVLISNLDDSFLVVKVPDPGLEELDFLQYLSDKLDFNKKFASKDMFFLHFNNFLHEASLVGKKVLLVIDECQRLSSRLLEEIIKLSDLGKDAKQSLKVLLIGQNEFNEVVLKNNQGALNELISINYAITPLNLQETGALIRHRLKIAGARKNIFSPDAITKIYQFSSGIPRRINIICDHALLIGFAREMKTINGNLIKACVEDLRPHDFTKAPDADSLDTSAGGNDTNLKVIPARSLRKVPANRVRKIFGLVVLIVTAVFLVVSFTGKMTFSDFFNAVKTGGMQLVNSLSRQERQGGNAPLQSDLKKSPVPQKETEYTAMPAEHKMPEKDLLDESVSVPSELAEDDKADAAMQTAVKSSWKDGLPVLDPIGGWGDGIHQTGTQSVVPAAPVKQAAIHDDTVTDHQVAPDTAVLSPSLPGPKPSEEAETEREARPATAAAPADMPHHGGEVTGIQEAPDLAAAEEEKATDNASFTQDNASPGHSSQVENSSPEIRNNQPDSFADPEEPAPYSAGDDDVQEKVDPGAVIDWILEKRSR